MASDELNVTEVLASLNGYVTDNNKAPKLRLFFQLTNIGSRQEVDVATSPLQFYNILCAHKHHRKRAKAMMQYMLECVGVVNAGDLHSDQKDLEACKDILAYPSILVEVCISLGDEDLKALKESLCTPDIKELNKLKCDPENVTSREQLFLKLHEATLISERDISLLVGKLEHASVGQKVLAEKVDDYAYVPLTTLVLFDSPTQESGNIFEGASGTVGPEEAVKSKTVRQEVHRQDSRTHQGSQLEEPLQSGTYQSHTSVPPNDNSRHNDLSSSTEQTLSAPLQESRNPSLPGGNDTTNSTDFITGAGNNSSGQTEITGGGGRGGVKVLAPPDTAHELQSMTSSLATQTNTLSDSTTESDNKCNKDDKECDADNKEQDVDDKERVADGKERGADDKECDVDDKEQDIGDKHRIIDDKDAQCLTDRACTILTCITCVTSLILFLSSLCLVIAFAVLGSNAATTTPQTRFFATRGNNVTLGTFDDPLFFSWNSLSECLEDSDTSHKSSFYLVNEQDVIRRNRFMKSNFTETINRTQADCSSNLIGHYLYLLSGSTINFEVCLASSEASDEHSTFLLFNSDPSYQQYLDSNCQDNQAILNHNLNIGKSGNFECTTIPTYTAQNSGYHYIVASTPANIHLRYKYNYTQLYLNPNDFPDGPFCELPDTNCVVPERDQSLLIVSVEKNEDDNSATTHLCLRREWKNGVIILVALLGIFCIVCLVIFIATCVSSVRVCKNRTKSESLS